MRVTDLKSDPLENIAVSYCQTLDPACTPLAEDTLTDVDGNVTLTVPYGLHGSLILEGPDDILPTLVYLEPPPTADSNEILIPLLNQADVALMSVLAQREVDPDTVTSWFARAGSPTARSVPTISEAWQDGSRPRNAARGCVVRRCGSSQRDSKRSRKTRGHAVGGGQDLELGRVGGRRRLGGKIPGDGSHCRRTRHG